MIHLTNFDKFIEHNTSHFIKTILDLPKNKIENIYNKPCLYNILSDEFYELFKSLIEINEKR